MNKFNDINYVRPNIEEYLVELENIANKIAEAESFDALKEVFLAFVESKKHVSTMMALAEIRNSIDMSDAFYESEVDYYNTVAPTIELAYKKINTVLLESSFIDEFTKEFGEHYVEGLKNSLRLSDEAIVEDQILESQLVQKYHKAAAVCKTTFHGEEVNFYGLLKYMQHTDRNIRKEAMMAWGDLYQSISAELDDIYSKLVEIRCRMADTLGFKDYVEMAYRMHGRYSYEREEVANFRKQIEDVLVPLCKDLYDAQMNRLGIDHLYYYDEAMSDPNGNAVPIGTTQELIEKAQKMYYELSEETGIFFDFMVEHELFDLETKPSKMQGGYCAFLDEFKAPFIFSNFNKTSADADVLTHEAGHAFEAFTASKNFCLPEQTFSTSEINEIHSTAMEFFTTPWMELFFEDQADKYRFTHLAGGLICIPYMACVDEFQHRVFEEKLVDADARYGVWHELEQKYMPWRDYDGHKFLENGGFWLQKQHIFMAPFYYIDYALAHMGALEYYGRMKEDRKLAWEDYYRLCNAGGSTGYFELLKIGNLHNPFEDGVVKMVVDKVKPELFK